MPERIDLTKMDLMENISYSRLYNYYEDAPMNFASHRLAISVTTMQPQKHAGNFLPWMIILDDDKNGTLYEGAKHNLQGYKLNCKDANKTCIVNHFDRAEFKKSYNLVGKHLIKNESLREDSLKVVDEFVHIPDNQFKGMTFGEVLELAKVVRAMGELNAILEQGKDARKETSVTQPEKKTKSILSFFGFGKSKNNGNESRKDTMGK